MSTTDDLREEYTGYEEILPDTLVMARGCGTFHRPSADGEAAGCKTASDNWQLIDSGVANKLGLEPCRSCFAGVFGYFADRDDNGVEHAESVDVQIDEEPLTFEEIVPDGGLTFQGKPITSRPEEVLVATNSTKDVYHAPTADGPLCGNAGGFRRVERVTLAGHAEPCRECFEVDEIDTSTP